MSYETLDIERQGAVATVWMNRPEVFNAFNEQLIDDLAAACRALEGDACVRVVVLAGRGRHFSAGADLNWMQRASACTEAENLADARKFAAMLQALSGLPKPTIPVCRALRWAAAPVWRRRATWWWRRTTHSSPPRR